MGSWSVDLGAESSRNLRGILAEFSRKHHGAIRGPFFLGPQLTRTTPRSRHANKPQDHRQRIVAAQDPFSLQLGGVRGISLACLRPASTPARACLAIFKSARLPVCPSAR